MNWHFAVQSGFGVDTLEVDVQYQLFVGVHLEVTEQHFGFFTAQFHVQDACVESFFFQGVPQGIVVKFDQLGLLIYTAINNTRCLT